MQTKTFVEVREERIPTEYFSISADGKKIHFVTTDEYGETLPIEEWYFYTCEESHAYYEDDDVIWYLIHLSDRWVDVEFKAHNEGVHDKVVYWHVLDETFDDSIPF